MHKLIKANKIDTSLGLLIIRVGIGVMFVIHGWPKLAAGPEGWEQLGKSMGMLGIRFAPAFWGFMGGFAETFGGVCLILGIFWVPACLLLVFTMIIAAMTHIVNADGFSKISHPIEAGIVFLGLIFTGAGKYKIGK